MTTKVFNRLYKQYLSVFPDLVPSQVPILYTGVSSPANLERNGRVFSTQSAIPYDPFRYCPGGFSKRNVVYIYEGSHGIRQIYG